jgi:hypothetical protein
LPVPAAVIPNKNGEPLRRRKKIISDLIEIPAIWAAHTDEREAPAAIGVRPRDFAQARPDARTAKDSVAASSHRAFAPCVRPTSWRSLSKHTRRSGFMPSISIQRVFPSKHLRHRP